MPAVGMSLRDLVLQECGAAWIAGAEPVDLSTSMIGADDVPPTVERRDQCRELCRDAGWPDAEVLEGLYLRRHRAYLVLLRADEDAIAVNSDGRSVVVGFPQASSWRRLAWAVGVMRNLDQADRR